MMENFTQWILREHQGDILDKVIAADAELAKYVRQMKKDPSTTTSIILMSVRFQGLVPELPLMPLSAIGQTPDKIIVPEDASGGILAPKYYSAANWVRSPSKTCCFLYWRLSDGRNCVFIQNGRIITGDPEPRPKKKQALAPWAEDL